MNAAGYAFHTWVPYLTFPVRDAEDGFRRGFLWSAFAFLGLGSGTWVVAWLWEREKERTEGRLGEGIGDEERRGLLVKTPEVDDR